MRKSKYFGPRAWQPEDYPLVPIVWEKLWRERVWSASFMLDAKYGNTKKFGPRANCSMLALCHSPVKMSALYIIYDIR